MFSFRSPEQKVNPGTDCFCAHLFPLSFFLRLKSILVLVLLHLWEMFLLTIWSVLSVDNFLNDVFFAQETWFQWFCKADCLCGQNDGLICGVYTNIGSLCWRFYFLWCSQMLDCEWVCNQNRVVTFCESCLSVRFLVNTATFTREVGFYSLW